MGSSIYCSLIYFWVPSSCFCIVISLYEGETIPFSGVCQSGRLHYPRRSVVASRTDWPDCFDVQPTTTSGNIITQSIIFQLSIANSTSCILHRAQRITLTHLHVSNCRVRQLQFSGIFVALGFVGNGVITVWLTAHDRQTMMQITRAEIMATLLILNLSDCSARFFEFCNQAVSLMLNWP